MCVCVCVLLRILERQLGAGHVACVVVVALTFSLPPFSPLESCVLSLSHPTFYIFTYAIALAILSLFIQLRFLSSLCFSLIS